jgi:hypothetical protein
MDALGVECFRSSPDSCSTVVYYNPELIGKRDVLRVLEEALHEAALA